MPRPLPVLLLGLLAACAQDRPRPDPVEPDPVVTLQVTVGTPAQNATVLGARPLLVEIQARDDEQSRLTGLGFLTRRNGVRQDSVVIRFPARRDSTHIFSWTVPDLPTNTQLDIIGLALGPGGEFKATEPVGIVIVRCQPGFPGC